MSLTRFDGHPDLSKRGNPTGPPAPRAGALAALLDLDRPESFRRSFTGAQASPSTARFPAGRCSTRPVIAGAWRAIHGQVMALGVRSSRPNRRSDDGQTILNTVSEGKKLRPHLGKLVELRGLESLASCMPFMANPSGRSREARRWRDGIPARRGRAELLRLSAWRARRSGINDVLISPVTGLPGQAADIASLLLDHVRDALDEARDTDTVRELLAAVLARGNGAIFQRNAHRGPSGLIQVVSSAVEGHGTLERNSPSYIQGHGKICQLCLDMRSPRHPYWL